MVSGVSSGLSFWRRLDRPGHEAARLWRHDPIWQLTGTAVFEEDGHPCRLEYLVACDAEWRTIHARVTGWVGHRRLALELNADRARRWRLNGIPHDLLDGCLDVDLAFSPATNLLPIRRLALAEGGAGEAQAAWVRFPELSVEPLHQRYHRISAESYRYETLDGAFAAELQVNTAGFVTRYPGLWEAMPCC